MQDAPSQFLVYAALFRLGIVGLGGACVVLGYRLLSQALEKKAGGRSRAADGSVVAVVGEARFALRNLAPGTMFAAFGMVIIAIMLYEGMPEFRQQQGDGSVVLRSDPQASNQRADLSALIERAGRLQQANHASAAIEAYEQALDLVAEPANNLAGLYLQTQRTRDALPLALLAAQLRPSRAGILDTLADAYEQTGNHEAALEAARRAAALDPRFRTRVDALQRREPR